MPPDFDEGALGRTKSALAFRILWERVVTTPMPLVALEFLNMPIIPRAQAQEYSPQVLYALDVVDFLKTAYAHSMVAVIPTYNTLTELDKDAVARGRSLFEAAAATNREVVDMADYMPAGVSKQTWASWYNTSNGHFNDNGASVFAHAMHRALRERLMQSTGSAD